MCIRDRSGAIAAMRAAERAHGAPPALADVGSPRPMQPSGCGGGGAGAPSAGGAYAVCAAGTPSSVSAAEDALLARIEELAAERDTLDDACDARVAAAEAEGARATRAAQNELARVRAEVDTLVEAVGAADEAAARDAALRARRADDEFAVAALVSELRARAERAEAAAAQAAARLAEERARADAADTRAAAASAQALSLIHI